MNIDGKLIFPTQWLLDVILIVTIMVIQKPFKLKIKGSNKSLLINTYSVSYES